MKRVKGIVMKRLIIFCLLSMFSLLEAGWWDVAQSWVKPVTSWYGRLDERGKRNLLLSGVAVLGAGVVGLYYVYALQKKSEEKSPVGSLPFVPEGVTSVVQDIPVKLSREAIYEKLYQDILDLTAGAQCFPRKIIQQGCLLIIPVVNQDKRADLWPTTVEHIIANVGGGQDRVSLVQLKIISEGTNCLYQAIKNSIYGVHAFSDPVNDVQWFKNMQSVEKYQEFLVAALNVVIPRRDIDSDRRDALGRNAEEAEGFRILSPGIDMTAFVPESFNVLFEDLKKKVCFIDRFDYYTDPTSYFDPASMITEKPEIIALTRAALQDIRQNPMATCAFVVNSSANLSLDEGGDAHWLAFLVHQNNGKRFIYYMDSKCPEERGKIDQAIWNAVRKPIVDGFIALLGPIPTGH